MIIIGVDPGLTGALASINHRGLVAGADMPVMQRSKGRATVKNQVNAAALADLLRRWLEGYDKNEIRIFIERVQAMPKQGVSTMFSMGHTCGIIEGVVTARGYPHELVTPREWKKVLKLASDKAQARTMAQRLYPEAPLALAKHHNRAEAILIARYGYHASA